MRWHAFRFPTPSVTPNVYSRPVGRLDTSGVLDVFRTAKVPVSAFYEWKDWHTGAVLRDAAYSGLFHSDARTQLLRLADIFEQHRD